LLLQLVFENGENLTHFNAGVHFVMTIGKLFLLQKLVITAAVKIVSQTFMDQAN
jgi:hypothetical protein